MAVAKIVDSNNWNSCCFASPFHFMLQIGFGKWEYPLIRCQGIIHLKVIPHLFTEKLRHYNDPVAFRCFRRSNNVLLFHPVVRFIDPHRLFLKIKICRCEGKQLPFPDSGPVQHLKGIIGSRLVHHCLSKFQILFLCPEFHFLWNLFSHTSCLSCRIAGQIIIVHRMIENCCKLCLNRFQIIHGIGLALSSRYAIISFCQAITSATVISLIFRFPK